MPPPPTALSLPPVAMANPTRQGTLLQSHIKTQTTMKKSIATLTLLLLFGAATTSAYAGGDDDKKHAKSHHALHAAVFFGAANTSAHTDFALGGDVEYRLPWFGSRMGVGAIADAVFAEHTHVLTGGGVFVHPAGGLKVLVAPAAAFSDGHKTFVLRSGLSYEMHLGGLTVAPTLNLDFDKHHTTQVFGIAVGASL